MSLLLLFQPATAQEEDVVVVVVEPPTIIDPIPLELVRIIPAPMGVGDQPRHSVKWY